MTKQILPKPVTFTAKAQRAGCTPAQYQARILSDKNMRDNYDAITIRQAEARKALLAYGRSY
jgi:hypothetical protein